MTRRNFVTGDVPSAADFNRLAQIQNKSATDWAALNPVLSAGEMGFDTTNKMLKVGDGATAWAALPGVQQFLQSGAAAVYRSTHAKLRDAVSVKDFGAVGDGVTNDTAAVAAAIALSADGRPVDVFFPPSTSGYVVGRVLIPSNVSIDLGGNLLIGTGGTGFETATWVGGVLTTNIGTAAETTLVRNARVFNGRMRNYLKAFNLQDFIWGSAVRDIEFIDCGFSLYCQRCFYSSFANLNTNGLLGGHTGSAYFFAGVNNLLELTAVTVAAGSARTHGFDLVGNDAQDSNFVLDRCGCEGMTNGIEVTGYLNSLKISGCYFEALSGTAIEMSGATNKRGVDIDNNWFYNVLNAVKGRFCLSGRWGVNNRLYTDGKAPTPAVVDFADDYANGMVVEIPTQINFANVTTHDALPSNYLIGPGCTVDWKRTIVNSSGVTAISALHTTTPIPLHYTGTGGTPANGVIPFCAITYPAGISGSVVVDTWIPFAAPDMVGVNFSILCDSGLWQVSGIIIGGFYLNANPGGKTVTISNNAGFIRITVGVLDSSSASYVATGAVRIL